MSRTFSTNSGSLESFPCATRYGCRPNARQTRETVDCERPRAAAIRRVDQCVPPSGGTHWSTRRMAAASGLSQSTVSRVWRAFGLQPHRVEHWKLSKDPLFVEKVRDIVGLYPVSYTHLRAHETDSYLVCRLLLEKKKIKFNTK